MSGVGFSGRKVQLAIAGVGNIAIREKSVTLNQEFIDVSSGISDGWVYKLAEPGEKSLEIAFSGVVENLDLLMSALTNTSQIYACTLTYPEGSVVSGNFAMASISNAMPYKDATTFESSLASSGEITFTAGS